MKSNGKVTQEVAEDWSNDPLIQEACLHNALHLDQGSGYPASLCFEAGYYIPQKWVNYGKLKILNVFKAAYYTFPLFLMVGSPCKM